MATDVRLKEGLPEITEGLVGTYTECSRLNHLAHQPLPSRDAVTQTLAELTEVLYPGYGRRQNLHMGNVEYHVGDLIDGLHDKLMQQISRVLRHEQECAEREMPDAEDAAGTDFEALAQQKAIAFLRVLPTLRTVLNLDAQAAFEGDPAAKSYQEIIFCYPGLEAISIYRIAHQLLLLGVPSVVLLRNARREMARELERDEGTHAGPRTE